MEVLLWGHGGDGCVIAVLVRCHGGHGGAAANPLRIGPTRGGTAEVLNMFNVSAVPPRRSCVFDSFLLSLCTQRRHRHLRRRRS